MERVISAVLQMIKSFLKTTTEYLPDLSMMAIRDIPKSEPKVSEIVLKRFAYHPVGTLGVILLQDQKFWTIERPWLENAPNVSCIPEGRYEMGWRTSPRFGDTWHIQDVPDRTHILIHVANFSKDVQGCIGLGMDLMGDTVAVGSSKVAVKKFEEMTKGKEWMFKVENAPFAAL